MKKNVGTRTRPIVRTPEQQRKHRAEQAARAILAGRNREQNWARIERHLADIPSKPSDFCGLEIPEPIEARLWPDPVEEIGTLVVDPILGECIEIDLTPDAVEQPAA